MVIGVLIAMLLVVSVAATPLIAVPFVVAGASARLPSAEAAGQLPAVKGDWGYPLAGAYTKGRGFGYNPVVGCSYCSTDHQGYDMAQACGATIYAAGPGQVITAGVYQGYGNTVRIDHGDGLITLYGHMQWNSLSVASGDSITAGTPLGAEGNTGRSFGCHLHFEVQQAGAPVDPQPFMAARGLPLT
ncbi:M23 family metallopeptidase [Microbacterium sp. NPDC057407]|uniref:M23 family metallopeptidase n=1 Tax=Microbacterium sp. NPDC057407 TaxID=3346120 RepID=UPI00366AE1B2